MPARPMIGGGARGMIERALVLEGRAAAPADVDALYASFVAHYAEHIADRSRPFPGVEPVLDHLAAAGYALAVCTNKLEWLSKKLLDALQLSGRFAAICGQDTFGIQKPDPQIFRATVMRAGGDPARAIMVGDSITDIRTARAAKVPIVAVDFGYTDVPVADIGAGSGDQLLRGTAGRHCRSRTRENYYGRSGLYRAQKLIMLGIVIITCPVAWLMWSRGRFGNACRMGAQLEQRQNPRL